jgi:S-formylglutathione hydrolase FrmB
MNSAVNVDAASRGGPAAAVLASALFCTACGSSSELPADSPTPQEPQDYGLQFLGSEALGPRLSELRFRTEYLDEDTGVRVLLPTDYLATGLRYPVLYLLNGSLDDQTAWTTKGDATAITEDFPLIVVMPSGGADGSYSDHYNFGSFGNPRWESYHITQLIPWIDAHYRTVGTRAGRAVAGLSAGGGGAMKYAARHPQLFVAAAAFSGAVDTNYPPLIGTPDLPSSGRLPYSPWGFRLTDEVRWRGNNSWDLAENLQGLALVLRSHNGLPGNGTTGDPVEATVYRQSVNLHEKLDALGIAHRWHDSGAGGHDWRYWNEDLAATLPTLMEVFANPPAPPSPFDFDAIENVYQPYGWRVEMNRAVLEFSRLANAGPDGFSLSGSGHAVVTTAALFSPDATYGIKRESGADVETLELAADGDGRLTVPVPLGPANPYQQYTVQAQLAGMQVYTTHVRIVR